MDEELKKEFCSLHEKFGKLDALDDKMDKLYNKLFVGNGSLPWDVRLALLERFKTVVQWIGGALFIGVVVRMIYDAVSG